jgi:hypothetical protein
MPHIRPSPRQTFDASRPPAAVNDGGTMIDEVSPMVGRSADDPGRPVNLLNLLEKSGF